MQKKMILKDKEPKLLSDNVCLVSPIQIHWDVVEVNEGDQTKLRRKPSHHPIRIVLREHLGTDCELLKLMERAAGFSMKITYCIDIEKDGEMVKTDILDIDLGDQIPDDISVDSVVELALLTRTTPIIKF
ncbi:MAG: hypothetical protein K2X38_16505 [Gemmataceae bacterium]|nr:hypothetical protein [Gemmataceae bacterium]